MRLLLGKHAPTILGQLLTLSLFATQTLCRIDLTAANRRPPITGLPDWSKAGYMQGARDLPTEADCQYTYTPQFLRDTYGLIPDDGVDDTHALEQAIYWARYRLETASIPEDGFICIQLPAGTINVSKTVFIPGNYLIIRGAGNDPDHGGTKIVYRPNADTRYDGLTPDGSQWDLDGMDYSWDYEDPTTGKNVKGKASAGWLWPGRSIFRIGSNTVAVKFNIPYDSAPTNRKDYFEGSINYHWSTDHDKVKGFIVDQSRPKAGYMGQNKVYVNASASFSAWDNGDEVWIASPAKKNDFLRWGVTNENYYVNSYIYQDMATITGSGNDADGFYILLDHPLRFDVYRDSVADGSDVMQDAINYAKVMPINMPALHVGIENLYMTQEIDGLNVADSIHNYGNMKPDQAMHGIVLRYAKNCWVRNVRTYMTGSHPVATEAARHIQIQDNYFDGSWNKGKGGNGYLRGSRVWDSIYFNNTQRNLRHFTFQWCAMGNVASFLNVTNDINLHGGWEGFNLIELNFVSIPFSHRSGKYVALGNMLNRQLAELLAAAWRTAEARVVEKRLQKVALHLHGGQSTSTGAKASKWSGASGPQNVFFRNYMIKEPTPGADYVEYSPYFARDGSLSDIVWEFGWDQISEKGDHYVHLSQTPDAVGTGLLQDWQDNERFDYAAGAGMGVNGRYRDQHTSLFLRDVSGAAGTIADYDSIAGYAYCRGQVTPKVVGYYLATAGDRLYWKWNAASIEVTKYTHIIFAYGNLASDGTLSLTTAQRTIMQNLVALKARNSALKIYLGVGGWGLGASASAIQAMASNSANRGRLGTSSASLISSLGFDGIDIEWASPITASQFRTIVTTVKTTIGSAKVSISTPKDFWSLSGVNVVTTDLKNNVEFASLITHSAVTTLSSPNSIVNIAATLEIVQRAGFPPDLVLMGTPFYGRSYTLSSSSCYYADCSVSGSGPTSKAIRSTELGQNTFPYYAMVDLLGYRMVSAETLADKENLWNQDTFAHIIILSDGSVVEYDDEEAIRLKAGRTLDLCMGGLAVFSIDQDTPTGSLIRAIWDDGGLTPPASELALGGGFPLNNDGLVELSYWETATTALVNNYPYLTMRSAYRVLLNVALKAQSAIANRLREEMQNSELSNENFELYKKWESKAMNYGIANATGLGKQYWECSINDLESYSANNCPGFFEAPFDYPQWTDELGRDVVHWRLHDHDGFRTFLNDTLHLDVDDLVPGIILVNRVVTDCVAVPGPGTKRDLNTTEWADPADSDAVDDGTGRVRWPKDIPPRKARLNKRNNGPSPYDPDPDCYTTWVGIPLVNATSFFVDMPQAIADLLSQHDYQLDMGYEIASWYFVEPYQISSALEASLTTISIANSTLSSVAGYIDAVKHDQDLQKESDRFNARNKALEIFLEIGLSLIGLIPIPGLQVPAFLERAWVVIKNLSPLAKLGRATGALREETAFTKALVAGVKDAKDVERAAANFEGSLTKEIRDTRGSVGQKMVKNNDKIKNCNKEKYQGLMDAADLATQFIPPPETGAAARRRDYHESLLARFPPRVSNSTRKAVPSKDLDLGLSFESSHYVATPPSGSASGFKGETRDAPGVGYNAKCRELTDIIEWTIDDGESYQSGTMANCPPGQCQCDHIFEAFQIKNLLRINEFRNGNSGRKFWTTAEVRTLCAQFDRGFKQDIMDIMNRDDNLAGIASHANGAKNTLVDSNQLQTFSHQEVLQFYNRGDVDVVLGHHVRFDAQRTETARLLDVLFQGKMASIQGTAAHTLLQARIPDLFPAQGVDFTPFRDIDTRNSNSLIDKIDRIKANWPNEHDLRLPSDWPPGSLIPGEPVPEPDVPVEHVCQMQ